MAKPPTQEQRRLAQAIALICMDWYVTEGDHSDSCEMDLLDIIMDAKIGTAEHAEVFTDVASRRDLYSNDDPCYHDDSEYNWTDQ